jgi:hypothetical protein
LSHRLKAVKSQTGHRVGRMPDVRTRVVRIRLALIRAVQIRLNHPVLLAGLRSHNSRASVSRKASQARIALVSRSKTGLRKAMPPMATRLSPDKLAISLQMVTGRRVAHCSPLNQGHMRRTGSRLAMVISRLMARATGTNPETADADLGRC